MAPNASHALSIGEGFSDGAGVFDGAAHDFGHWLLDHHFFAGVAADDGVWRALDVADFFSVDDEGLAVETGEDDHVALQHTKYKWPPRQQNKHPVARARESLTG